MSHETINGNISSSGYKYIWGIYILFTTFPTLELVTHLTTHYSYEIDNIEPASPEVRVSDKLWIISHLSVRDIMVGTLAASWWWLCQWRRCQGCSVEYLDYNMCIIGAPVMTCHWANYKIMDHRHLIRGYWCRLCRDLAKIGLHQGLCRSSIQTSITGVRGGYFSSIHHKFIAHLFSFLIGGKLERPTVYTTLIAIEASWTW